MGADRASRAATSVSLVTLGFAAAVAQAALLREAMAALGGSELAWGAVLALWLAGMGVGAFAGARNARVVPGWMAPCATLLLAAGGSVLLRAAPALVGASTGEAIGTLQAAWVWAAAILPAALAGGAAFAGLARATTPAAAYALESAGALVGGVVFTFALAPLGSVAALAVALGLAAAIHLRERSWIAAAAALAAGIAAGPLAGQGVARLGWRWSGRVDALAAVSETRQQRLELSTGTPAALYGDGALLASYPDPYRVAPRAHLVMLLHPRPRRVLAVGVLADGTLAAMLEHPTERVDLVEDDPALVKLLPAWSPALAPALADARVAVHTADPLRLVARAGPWDLIVLLDADPTTVRRSRTRTAEFFRACSNALAPGGLLVVRVAVGDTYVGGAGGRLLAIVASTLRESLPGIAVIPGEEVLLVAAAKPGAVSLDAGTLAARWRERRIDGVAFVPEMLPQLLDRERASALEQRLAASPAPANTRERPLAVPLAAALHEARGAPPLLRWAAAVEARGRPLLLVAFALAAAAVVASGARRRAAGLAGGAVVGLIGMGWWLALLSAWQATVGSVYAEVGALSAAFMAGVVIGTAALRRGGEAAARALPAVLLGGAALSGLLALELPLAFPKTACVPLLLVGGAATGAAFPGVAWLIGPGEPPAAAGRGFAADELGAAVGALAVGVLALPVLGLRATALVLAALGAAAASATMMALREPNG